MNGKTNVSEVVLNQIVNGALIPLEPATDLTIGSGSGRAYFTWTDPVDKYTTPGDELVSKWEKTVIVRKENSAPTNINDGTIVLTETTRNQYQSTQYNDTSVMDDTEYYYSVFPVTTNGLPSDPITDVISIPADGEPVFMKNIDNAFGYGNRFYNISAAANNAGVYFVNGQEYDKYDRDPVTAITAFNNEGTKIQLANTNEGARKYSVGKYGKYAVFHGGYQKSGNNYINQNIAYFIDNDMTLTRQQNLFKMSNSRGVSSDSYLIFAGGVKFGNYDSYRSWEKCAQSIDVDMTVQDLSDLDYYAGELYGTRAGTNYIFGLGNTYQDRYPGTTTLHMFAYNSDLVKETIDDLSAPTSQLVGAFAMVDEYGLITRSNHNSANQGDSTFYTEGYNNDLTHIESSSIATLEFSTIVENCGFAMPSRYARDISCVSYNQFGKYAIVAIHYDVSLTSHGGHIRFDKDLVLTYKDLDEYMLNIYDIYPYPSLEPVTIAANNDVYMQYACYNRDQSNQYGTMLIFTL